MSVKLYEKPDHSPDPLIAIIVIMVLLFMTSKCHAQQKAVNDTMTCKVVDYISTCKQFSLEPTLGIRLRNGVITSIVRYKIKFVHK